MAYMVFQNEKKWKSTISLSELLFWDTPLFISWKKLCYDLNITFKFLKRVQSCRQTLRTKQHQLHRSIDNVWKIYLYPAETADTQKQHFACIHPFSSAHPIQGRWQAGAYRNCRRARGRVHPAQVTSQSQGHRGANTLRCSHLANLESPVNI